MNGDLYKKFPWDIALIKRCKLLRDYIKKGYKIAVLLYGVSDDSTFRYRVYNIFEATKEEKSRWKTVFFFMHEIDVLIPYLNDVKILSLIRIQWSFELQKLVYSAKKCNVKIVFDTDDLVFDISYVPLLMNTLNTPHTQENYEYWFTYVSRIGLTASLCSGATTTNSYLGTLITDNLKIPFQVIPNSLNKGQLNISLEVCQKKKHNKRNSNFIIGYFSGSPSHINDFQVCSGEVIELMKHYNDISLLVVGYMEFPNYMKEFINNGRVIFHPFVNYLELQRLIGGVDVNIAPLVNNTFTNCKSELKFFEAAVVDTLTCATPTHVFKKSIQQRKTGYLCNSSEWYDTLEQVYLDRELTKQIVADAHSYVKEHYCGSTFLKAINDTYDYFADNL